MPSESLKDRQAKIAESIGVDVGKRHIFLCADQTKPKCCDRERSIEAWTYQRIRIVVAIAACTIPTSVRLTTTRVPSISPSQKRKP